MDRSDEFDLVVAKLRGLTLRIPNLDPIYGRWRHGFNVHYDRLVQTINSHLEALFQDKTYIEGVKSMDLAQFVCLAYPSADWPRLRVMGLYLVWLVLFDDEFDRKIDPDVADQASDLAFANRYRQDMYSYVESIVVGPAAVASRRSGKYQVNKATPPPIGGFFAAIAPHLLRAASEDVVNMPRLLHDLDFFMGSSNEEQQRFNIQRKFPTLEQYDAFRAGTGAVDAICDLHQHIAILSIADNRDRYVAGTRLPDDLVWAEEVMTMRREVNVQTCVSNDLLSLKKEIVSSMSNMTLISLVPIHVNARGTSLDEIVDELVREMKRSAASFDAAAEALREKARQYGQGVVDETSRFIDAFETFQTGCLAFYVKSRRFGVAEYQLPDGSFAIPLSCA
ncbi:isoprenoid synthase domain-containing protein [Lasiosphaeria miniovina]|uniref:Isoprenoid synthase domain-containing protein n=1 Tax=Lasiosphaeria miniovina TaxID=1954250 RepID=A0AA40AVL3_9PEZI|nr:isoprenoid synthase domain-containing protein [Lasiosphaeria miniovina]KAK0722817.1 isoprenoid synthase domain-containing protein [Lasiosphaeria miniovina]